MCCSRSRCGHLHLNSSSRTYHLLRDFLGGCGGSGRSNRPPMVGRLHRFGANCRRLFSRNGGQRVEVFRFGRCLTASICRTRAAGCEDGGLDQGRRPCRITSVVHGNWRTARTIEGWYIRVVGEYEGKPHLLVLTVHDSSSRPNDFPDNPETTTNLYSLNLPVSVKVDFCPFEETPGGVLTGFGGGDRLLSAAREICFLARCGALLFGCLGWSVGQGAEVIVKDRRHLTAVQGEDAALHLSSDASVRLRYASLVDYPELVPVLLSARAAVVEAFDIDESMQADLVRVLERVAVEAMVAAYAPMVVAATELNRVNEGSRSAQAVRVARVAEVMAVRIGEIAAQLHRRDEDSALRVAMEASVAADGVAASTTPGIGVAKAAEVAAAVHAAAESRAAEQASAAMVVAEMAASAALKVASEADAAAATVERKAFDAASSVQGIGLNMCYEIAIDAAASAAHRALARPLR